MDLLTKRSFFCKVADMDNNTKLTGCERNKIERGPNASNFGSTEKVGNASS